LCTRSTAERPQPKAQDSKSGSVEQPIRKSEFRRGSARSHVTMPPAKDRLALLINEMDYEVRLATINDADAFCPLLSSLGYPTDTTAIKERLSRILQTPDAVLLVAAHKTTDQVAGVLSIQFIPQLGLAGDVCHICFFVVAENLHRAGIGKLLESTAEELSRKRGCDRMVSLVPDFD